MKKIAVLTDFSERSANAGNYALELACRLHADILLYNAYLVPSAEPMNAQVAWQMEDYDEIKSGCETALAKSAAQLNAELDRSSAGFHPTIECRAQESVFNTSIDEFLNDRDVVLLVMGNHHQGFSSLMLGNHTRDVLDKASLPVLVVPKTAAFKDIHKIALATDLNNQDLQVIQSLANLARPFNAEILLVHLCERTPEHELQVDDFLHNVTNKINYPNIYYRQLDEPDVKKGLQQMAENVQAELMVMVHRRKNFLERLFGGSISQKLASASVLPLLIFPYPTETSPIF